MLRVRIAAFMSLTCAMPSLAQDLSTAEIVVTGARIEQDDYSRDMPAVGLRKQADFLVQSVTIRGDTRNEKERAQEIYAMLEKAIQLASKSDVELAFGDYILTRLTSANYKDIVLARDNRPDSQRINFLVKVKLGPNTNGSQAEERIEKFIDAVPEVGRAQLDSDGDSTLSVVGPDSYRARIATEIAQDARAMARSVGDDYAVQIEGLNMPVQWARSGPSDVMLFIPYKLTVVPKPGNH
jgi:hypothetical protein